MKNPYEVLEIREGATQEEIKQAYRELIKRYHPDKYSDNPLQDLAEEKSREINEAYEYLMKNTSGQGNSYRGNNNYSSGNNEFARIRQLINSNNLTDAEYELNRIGVKSAEWYYLRGVIAMRKGWYSQAYQDLQMAINMDPNNHEYRDTYNRAINNNNTYQASSYRRRGSSDDMCDICTCLCCSDQCCECMGGDLISCC